MNRQKEEQKAFECLLRDIINIKIQVDNVYLRLKRMQGDRIKNQDVFDFLEVNNKKGV